MPAFADELCLGRSPELGLGQLFVFRKSVVVDEIGNGLLATVQAELRKQVGHAVSHTLHAQLLMPYSGLIFIGAMRGKEKRLFADA